MVTEQVGPGFPAAGPAVGEQAQADCRFLKAVEAGQILVQIFRFISHRIARAGSFLEGVSSSEGCRRLSLPGSMLGSGPPKRSRTVADWEQAGEKQGVVGMAGSFR